MHLYNAFLRYKIARYYSRRGTRRQRRWANRELKSAHRAMIRALFTPEWMWGPADYYVYRRLRLLDWFEHGVRRPAKMTESKSSGV